MSPSPAPTDEIEATATLIRQRERTIDNVKRLYAFILSLSFANIIREIADRYVSKLPKYVAAALDHPRQAFLGAAILILAFLIFFFTAGVFYFQADRLLDTRYTLAEDRPGPAGITQIMPRWLPLAFAVEYFSLILTMIPFAAISLSFSAAFPLSMVMASLYFSYGLLFLMPGMITFARLGKNVFNRDRTPAPLTVHWLWLNSLASLLSGIGFLVYTHSWPERSPAPPLSATAEWALYFAMVAALRNYLDYSRVWGFLRLNGADDKPGPWLLPWLTSRGVAGSRWPRSVGLLLFIASCLVWVSNLAIVAHRLVTAPITLRTASCSQDCRQGGYSQAMILTASTRPAGSPAVPPRIHATTTD